MATFSKLLKNNWFVFALLAGLIIVTYFNSLGNGFVTDDEGLVKEGRNLINLGYIFGEPSVILRRVVYALVYLTTDLTPWVYRLTNIAFHLGASFVAFLIIKKLVNHRAALIAALIFSIHPLLSETVVWISAGGYAQYTFFFLLSLYFYITTTSKKWFFFTTNSKTHYVLSVIFYILALLSLNRALVLGLVFPLYEFSFSNRTGGLKKNWFRTLPFLLLSGAWLLTFFGGIGARATSLDKIYYKDGFLYNPFLQWPLAIGSYLSLLFWPGHLTYVHTNNQTTGVYLFHLLILLGVFGGIVWGFLKNRLVFFGLSLFLISLLPSLTPFKIAFIVAERYVYLGSLGLILLVGAGIDRLLKKKEITTIVVFSLVIILLALAVRTGFRNTDWKDPNTLWKKTAEVSADSSQAHLNLGVKYGKEQDYVRAEQEFIAAIQINPKIAEYYFNLGVVYFKTNRKGEAKEAFTKALELKPDYPDAKKGLDLSRKLAF